MGVQQTTVGRTASSSRSRLSLDIAPPGMHSAPSCAPASNPAQKPMNGPNPNGKKMRSAAVTPAARYTAFQQSTIHCQLAPVSSHRRGRPVVDDVW